MLVGGSCLYIQLLRWDNEAGARVRALGPLGHRPRRHRIQLDYLVESMALWVLIS